MGANPNRQPLQPEAIGAVMEATKWLPSLPLCAITICQFASGGAYFTFIRLGSRKWKFGILRRRGSEVEAVSQDSDKPVHDEDTYPKTVAPRCCGYCWPQSIHSRSTEPISKLRLSADTSCSSCKTRS